MEVQNNVENVERMSLEEIIALFEQVCDDASAFANLTVRRPNNPTPDGVSHIRNEVEKQIEEAVKNIETQPLVIPFLSGAMEYIKSIYAVSLDELLSGDFEPRRRRYERLMAELGSSPIALEWNETNRKISDIIERMGLSADKSLLADMPKVAEIMLNAFSFFGEYHTKTVKIASGASGDGPFTFLNTMPRFATTSEFYDAFRGVPAQNAVMIALVAPTHGQTAESLTPWANKVTEKYDNNLRLRGWNPSRCDDDNQESISSNECRIVTGVKRGENIWLIIHSDDSSRTGRFYEYGRRKSYMPFQVLFKDAPAPDTECTALALARPGAWDLTAILDPAQALWLPTFLWLIEKKFFTGPVDEAEELKYLPGMVRLADSPENSLLPAVQKTVAVSANPFEVPEKSGYESDPTTALFIKRLDIAESDLNDAVVTLRTPFADIETYGKEFWYSKRRALAFLAKTKLARDYRDNHRELLNYVVDLIHANAAHLLEELEKPDSPIHRMATHIIDGQPEVDADGKVKLVSGKYTSVKDTAAIMRTSIDSTRRATYSKAAVVCVPESLAGRRPPVTVILTPETPEDLAFLAGMPVEELPWQFILTGKCTDTSYHSFTNSKLDPMMSLGNPYKLLPPLFLSFSRSEYKALFPDRLLTKKKADELIRKAKEDYEKEQEAKNRG